MHSGWAGGGFGLLIGLLLLIAVIVLAVWAATNWSRSERAASGDPSRATPDEILRQRFARGEITRREFEDAKKVIGRGR
jgi:putative membrane protein